MSQVRARTLRLNQSTMLRPRHRHVGESLGRAASGTGLSAELTLSRSYRRRLAATDTTVILTAAAAGTLSEAAIDEGGPAPWPVSLSLVLLWSFALWAGRTRHKRIAGLGRNEFRQLVLASTLAFGLLAIAFLALGLTGARGFLLVSLPSGLAGLAGTRAIWRHWLRARCAEGGRLSRALVVGSSDAVTDLVERMGRRTSAAYNVVAGVIDQEDAVSTTAASTGIPVTSSLAGVSETAFTHGADTVLVAGPLRDDSDFIRRLSRTLEGSAVELVLASRLADIDAARLQFRAVGDLPLIQVEIPRFEGSKHGLKRALDVTASGLALLLLLPAFAVIALLVRLSSPGPAIFRQQRVGRNERRFSMLKFRTMVQDAEEALPTLLAQNDGAGVLFKLKDDPRVTRIGRVLRKYSIDELPQLWNVLVGDMSLVGPRPPLPSEVAVYENDVHRRLYIKPGLTGLWQVSGRSDLPWDEAVRLDLHYVENWSLAGDLGIIWRTIGVLLHPIGAY